MDQILNVSDPEAFEAAGRYDGNGSGGLSSRPTRCWTSACGIGASRVTSRRSVTRSGSDVPRRPGSDIRQLASARAQRRHRLGHVDPQIS